MEFSEWIVLGLGALFVLACFFAFKLPSDARSREVRKADFNRMFKRHIPADPREDVVVDAPKTQPERTAPVPVVKKVSAKDVAGLAGVEKIKALDPTFAEDKFLEGARAAYAYFYTCWNKRDEDGLAGLCAPRLVDEIAAEWEHAWQPVGAVEVSDVRLGEARVSGRSAIVEAVIEARLGTKKMNEIWVLARAMGSDDPNWELQSRR